MKLIRASFDPESLGHLIIISSLQYYLISLSLPAVPLYSSGQDGPRRGTPCRRRCAQSPGCSRSPSASAAEGTRI